MVFPSNAPATFPTLYLKGVKHLQDSNEGTRTELTLCLLSGLGGKETVGDEPALSPPDQPSIAVDRTQGLGTAPAVPGSPIGGLGGG